MPHAKQQAAPGRPAGVAGRRDHATASPHDGKPPRKPLRSADAVLMLISVVAALLIGEIAMRLAFGVPVLTLRDWRALNANILHASSAYDPLLGWVQANDVASNGFNTLDHGIRKNSEQDETLEQGAILAVGDSFAAGSEVVDEQTWPAQLERATGLRVLNGGVGGYGVDQIALNAERLLPILRPRLVLVGMLADDIERSRYRIYNAPKPYFAEAKGVWTLQNVPVPREIKPGAEFFGKTMLARSFAFHVLMQRQIFRDFWFTGQGPVYDRAHNDGAGASCAALDRLGRQLAATGTRGVVVMQYGGWEFARASSRIFGIVPRTLFGWKIGRAGSRPADVVQVLACARSAGFGVVDEFDVLAGIARGSLDRLKDHYVMHAEHTSYGHMSATGNALVASLIFEQLRQAPGLAAGTARVAPAAAGDNAAGINRVTNRTPESYARANVTLAPVAEAGPVGDSPVLRLAATEKNGEHYLVATWTAPQGGPFTFSTYVRADPGMPLRLQLLDDRGNAAIADFVIGGRTPTVSAAGKAGAPAASGVALTEGWERLSVSALLPGRRGSVLIQLAHPQLGTSFAGPGVEIAVQAPMVEAGRAASPYCAPGRCRAGKS